MTEKLGVNEKEPAFGQKTPTIEVNGILSALKCTNNRSSLLFRVQLLVQIWSNCYVMQINYCYCYCMHGASVHLQCQLSTNAEHFIGLCGRRSTSGNKR